MIFIPSPPPLLLPFLPVGSGSIPVVDCGPGETGSDMILLACVVFRGTHSTPEEMVKIIKKDLIAVSVPVRSVDD